MLGRVELVAAGVEGDTAGIADAGCVALGRREFLIGLLRVVAPDAATRLQLSAGVQARRLARAILLLARIGRARHIDVDETRRVDCKSVLRMVAGQRQMRD